MTKRLFQLIALGTALLAPCSYAQAQGNSCYQALSLEPEQSRSDQALYILVDQSAPVPKSLQQSLVNLTSDWPNAGERIKIIRFSSTIGGEYTELVLDLTRDATPSEDYLYNLRDADRSALQRCLDKQAVETREKASSTLASVLAKTNPKLAKSDILKPLKRIAEDVLAYDDIPDKTVLIISNGLENSEVANFGKRQRKGDIDPERSLKLLKEKRLDTDWRGATIYMANLGQPRDTRQYVRPSITEPLTQFWKLYFTGSNGRVRQLGAPAILASSLR